MEPHGIIFNIRNSPILCLPQDKALSWCIQQEWSAHRLAQEATHDKLGDILINCVLKRWADWGWSQSRKESNNGLSSKSPSLCLLSSGHRGGVGFSLVCFWEQLAPRPIHYVFTIPIKECLLSELLLEISVAIYIFEMVKDSFGKYQFSWDKNHGVPGRGKARGCEVTHLSQLWRREALCHGYSTLGDMHDH